MNTLVTALIISSVLTSTAEAKINPETNDPPAAAGCAEIILDSSFLVRVQTALKDAE